MWRRAILLNIEEATRFKLFFLSTNSQRLYNQRANSTKYLPSVRWSSLIIEGLFQIESTVTRVENEIENAHPSLAGQSYHYLGTGQGGGDIECFQKLRKWQRKQVRRHAHSKSDQLANKSPLLEGALHNFLLLHS